MKDKNKKNGNSAEPVVVCETGTCHLPGPARNGHPDDEFMEDLLESLDDKAPDEELTNLEELVPQKLWVSERCLRLGQMIGPAAKKIGGDTYEVGGFFLFEKGDDSLYRQFIVPKNLEVTIGSIRIDENYDDAAREIKQNNLDNKTKLKLGAMFHVHPSAGTALYHSQMDDDSLKNLVNKMAKSTRRIHEAPYRLIEGALKKEYEADGICLRGDALSDAIKRFVFPNDELFFRLLQDFGLNPDAKNFDKNKFLDRLLESITDKTYEPRAVSFAVSFVFDNHGSMPFVKMGMEERFCLTDVTNYETVEKVPIEMVEKGIKIPSQKEVEAIVNERVKFKKYVFTPQFWPAKSRRKRRGGTVFVPVSGTPGSNFQTVSFNNWMENQGYFDNQKEQPSPKKTVLEKVNEALGFGAGKKSNIELALSVREAANKDITPPSTLNADSAVIPENYAKKTDSTLFTAQEIAKMFALAATSYVVEYRHRECRYSTYMDQLLETISEYQQSAGYYYTETLPPLRCYGLRSSVIKTGKLVADAETLVEKPNKLHDLGTIVTNILDELDEEAERAHGIPRKLDVNFMLNFADAKTTEERNVLLEKYVEEIFYHHEILKKENKGKK